MSEVTVICPNCNTPVVFDPEEGTKCGLCFQKLAPIQYIGKRIGKLGYSTTHTMDGLNIENGLGVLTYDKIKKELRLELVSLKNTTKLIESLMSLGVFLKLSLTQIDPRANICPVCSGVLSYTQTFRSGYNKTHFIGCVQMSHHFIYSSVEVWLGSTLLRQYPKFKFTASESGLYVFSVDKKPNTKGRWIWKEIEYTDVETNHGMIDYQANGDQLAIWVPKSLLPAVIDIYSYLSGLNIKNVKIVSVNT